MPNWKIEPVDQEAVQSLQQSLHISETLASILLRRGIDDPEKARYFLYAGWSDLQPPELIPGLNDAVRRIEKAIENGERMVIYGDYDVDGVCGTVILLECLQLLGAKAEYYIPDRFSEGYGLNCEAVEKLAARGVQLLVTVDCGINSVQEIARAHELGLEVIVTDHHTPESVLPEAEVIVNPRLGAPDEMKELCGAGIAFKLVQKLGGRNVSEPQLNQWLELAALATVADIVPLLGENRILVKEGIKRIKHTGRPGLKALIQESNIKEEELQAYHLGFILAPRINAAGRLKYAGLAVDLLMTQEEGLVLQLARELCRLNEERRRIEQAVVEEAAACVDNMDETQKQGILMIDGESWHPGVIGIAASRLADQYGLPVVLVSWDGDMGRGSARSIPGFNLYEALYACQDSLERFGGHAMAAGLSLHRSRLEYFRQRLQEQTLTAQPGADMIICLDGELFSHQITMHLVRELEKMGPYGEGNPMPLFLIHHDRIERASLMGSDRSHFRAVLQPGNVPVISFRQAAWIEHPFRECRFDVLANLDINSYQGKTQVQIKAVYLEPSYKNYAVDSDLQLQRILDKSIHTLRSRQPVVFTFPTYRILRYYQELLNTFLLPSMIYPLHGHLPKSKRSAAEAALSSGQPLVFLLTESYCQYLDSMPDGPAINSGFVVRFWPLAPGLAEEETSCCYPSIKDQPQIKLTRNLNSPMNHTLLYINSQETKGKLVQQWSKATQTILVSDWTFSVSLSAEESDQADSPAPLLYRCPTKADQVILADPPYSCYEALITAQQLAASSFPVSLQAEFTPQQLMNLGEHLQHLYPERTIIGKIVTCLGRIARKGFIRDDIGNLAAEVSRASGCVISEEQIMGGLRTMSDLGLCLYRKKGSIIEIKMLVSTAATLDLADSPFYREGQTEKRAFSKWEQWVTEQMAW